MWRQRASYLGARFFSPLIAVIVRDTVLPGPSWLAPKPAVGDDGPNLSPAKEVNYVLVPASPVFTINAIAAIIYALYIWQLQSGRWR